MHQLLKTPKYSKLWGKLYTKELSQLAQGVPGTAGTNTIVFILYADNIPLNHMRHITYGKNVDTYRPEKEDPNWTRLTVGGNRIVYPGDVFTPTVEIMTVKMHLNSVISTKSAKYCTFNIKDVYLNTLMAQPKFMRIKLSELATTRIFQPVQPQQHHCQLHWHHIHQGSKGHVRPPTSKNPHTATPGTKAQQERIPPTSHHTRNMEARHLPYFIHTLR